MATVTKEAVLEKLRTVHDPELHRDLVSLNMIKEVAIEGARVRIHIELTTPACPLKDQIAADVQRAVSTIPGVRGVDLEWSAQVRGAPQPRPQLSGVKNILSVGAGKGGVGKSTIAAMIAMGLRRAGASVGLLDADVYGPSIPTLMGIEGVQPKVSDKMLLPIEVQGIRTMSVGVLVERDRPMVLRGPMLHGILRQFLDQVEWGELDYLVVDLPPGTGDVPLTLAQSIPQTGAVIVCTPQDVALADARRAIMMFRQLNVGILGIVENMSYYLCPKCGHRDELFDHGGAARAATEMDVPFLGEIPLNATVRAFCDAGAPDKLFTETPDYVRRAVDAMVQKVAGRVSVANLLQAQGPKLTVE